MPVLVRACALAAALLAPAAAARAQEAAVRFEIHAVSDSTFAFPVGSHRWVRPGEKGIAVDPRRRDALVARFQVLSVDAGVATALVTGETTRLTAQHIALLDPPARPWYRQSFFWMGAVAGSALGVLLSALSG